MKNFLIFILLAVLLIVSEYFLLNEFFTHRRAPILMLSLFATLACIYGAHRFFKKNILPGKPS